MRHSGSGGGVTGVSGETPVSDDDTHTKLDAVNANLDSIELKLDAANTSLDSIEVKLDTANTNLVTIQGKQDAQTALLTDIDTNTDGLEALITSTNTKLDAVNSNLDSANGNLDSIETKLDTLHSDLIANGSYLTGNITATTTEVAARVGGANLANRRMLTIYNQSGANIFYGPTGVTSANGVRMPNNTDRTFEVGPAVTVFVIRASGSGTVTIQEWA